MARLLEKYENLTRDSEGVLTGPLNKLWRARILLNRAISPLPKDNSDKGKIYNPNIYPQPSRGTAQPSTLPQINQKSQETFRVYLKKKYKVGKQSEEPIPNGNVVKNQTRNVIDNSWKNKVVIYNLNLSPYKYITIQNRPNSIDFRGETSWATIKSMGRNVPMYHYTGAEDTVQFNISWFCNDPNNPEEVLNKCRLLEAWTKSNGYQSAPPVLKIQWGDSGIFDNHQYILTSATYTLNNFQSGARVYKKDGTLQEVIDKRLLPSTATQELIFKRVSAYNLSYQDFINSESLNKTGGVKI